MSTTNEMAFHSFIAALPLERQQPMTQVWRLVQDAVPAGYTEHVGPKFLEFRAGAEICIALANQKSHMSLHLVPIYLLPALREQLAAAAPRLKMGKGCVNFTRVEELPLDALVKVINATLLADYVAALQATRTAPRQKS